MFDEPFGVRVVFAPEMDKLGKMVGTKDGPIPSEVVKVVHDDSNEEVEDEEGADNEEADEVGIGNVGATTSFLSGIVRCFVTWSIFPEYQWISVPKDQGNISEEIFCVFLPRNTIQHDLLPSFTGRRSEKDQECHRERLEVVVSVKTDQMSLNFVLTCGRWSPPCPGWRSCPSSASPPCRR